MENFKTFTHMKTFLSILTILILHTFSFSQTKLIALKSHSGSVNQIDLNSNDNFGNPSPIYFVRQVIFKKVNDSLIYKYSMGPQYCAIDTNNNDTSVRDENVFPGYTIKFTDTLSCDTIREHAVLLNNELSLDEIKSQMGTKAIYDGFESTEKLDKNSFFSNLSTKDSIYLIVFICAGFFIRFKYKEEKSQS